jgi:hypothetical protein
MSDNAALWVVLIAATIGARATFGSTAAAFTLFCSLYFIAKVMQ